MITWRTPPRKAIIHALLLVTGLLAGCGSTIPSAQLRQAHLRQYLSGKTPQILIYQPRLSIRSFESRLGATDKGPELSALAGIGNPLQTVAEQFIAATGLPATTQICEVTPETLGALRTDDPNELVLLFFSGGWYLDYQRFPPDLQNDQLSFSIIGKLMPRGVVVSGGGTLALPRASWEASCYHVGGRFPLDSWQDNRGRLLKEQMAVGLDVCVDQLGNSFRTAMLEAQDRMLP